MESDNVIIKKVSDLGAASYLLIHGYNVIGRNGRNILFEMEKNAEQECDNKLMEYLSSDFHQFDSSIMSLKKISDNQNFECNNCKRISDLGAAGFLMMENFKVKGKQGRTIFFDVPPDKHKEFDRNMLKYLTSEYHRFDAALMSLKKLNEYMPDFQY